MPFTVPRSSLNVATVNDLLAALMREKLPLTLAAILLKALPLFNVTLDASRKMVLALSLAKLIAPVCVMVPAVSNVKTLVAKVASGVQAAIVILPAVLLPMRTLVANTSFNAAEESCKLPVLLAMLMLVLAV